MEKRKILRRFAAIGLSAAICISAMPICMNNGTFANGAFVSQSNDQSAVIMDERQISLQITPYEQKSSSVSVYAENDIVKGNPTSCEMLDRISLTIGVEAASGLSENRLSSIALYVHHSLNGAECPVRSIPLTSINKISDTQYELRYDFITYGTELWFETSYFSGVTDFNAEYCNFQSVSSDYLKAEATTPDGENLFVCIPAKVNTNSLQKWLKNIVMYINSLSDVTGFSRGTMYMLFDDAECAVAHSANYKLDSKKEINGFTVFGVDVTEETLAVMAEERNAISWCVMHELSHSYACHTANNTFDTNYNYHDEVHTNVRGITAIFNCENIRNIDIWESGNTGKYNTIYNKRTPDGNDFVYYMAKKFVNIGEQYGWNKLEFFFSADTANSDYNHSYSCETNLHAAAVLKEYLGLDVTVTNSDYLKFVNVLHRLYLLCWDHPEFEDASFRQFISVCFNNGDPSDNSGTDLIQRFVRSNIECPLAITNQLSDVAAKIGDSINLTVGATGENIKYQWNIIEPDNSTTVEHMDTPTYSYTLTEENNGRRIFCEIIDKYGKNLNTDTIIVGTPVEIISHPANTTGELNSLVSTSVNAAGCGLKYQWYERNAGTSYWARANDTDDTYSCTLTKFRDGKEVYCEITDAFGNKVRTRSATLGLPLEIIRQPINSSAPMGQVARTTLKASGSGLRYRWFIRYSGDIYWYSTSSVSPTYSCKIDERTKGSMLYCEVTDVFGRKKKTNTVLISEKR